jgi:hypothetical protein
MTLKLREKILGLAKPAMIATILVMAVMLANSESFNFSRTKIWNAVSVNEDSHFAAQAQQATASFDYAPAKKMALGSAARRAREAKSEPEKIPSMIVKTSDLSILVGVPAQEMARIEKQVQGLGGLVMTSTVEKRNAANDAVHMLVRVPVDRFEELRTAVKQGVIRVDRDSIEARDVTKEFVDTTARLQNLRAREEQYRAILRRAYTVEDTLQVTEKLSEVRGEIEALQGSLNYLKNQAEMSTLRISIIAEAEERVAGIHWRPLYQIKAAMMGGLAGLSDYANTMFVVLFRVPAILLWLLTLLVGGMVGWRLALWVWTRLKSVLAPAVSEKTA